MNDENSSDGDIVIFDFDFSFFLLYLKHLLKECLIILTDYFTARPFTDAMSIEGMGFVVARCV